MKIRMQITKEPEIRFVSHLDYLRAIERSLRRSGLPVAYSEGYNPHIRFSLASALGVGVVSYAEFVEMEMADPMDPLVAREQLQGALPRGIKILAVDAVDDKAPALMAKAEECDYRVTLGTVPENWEELAEKFNAAPSLLYRKAAPKRREGFKEVDIKRYVQKLTYEVAEGKLVLYYTVKIFEDGSLKATDVLQALGLDIGDANVERLALWRKKRRPMLAAKL